MKAKVTDKDKGYKRIVSNILNGRPYQLSVGVHEEEGGAASEGGLTVAEVAAMNEFGEGPPARPFISGWVDSNEAEINADLKKAGEAVAKGTPHEVALERVGLRFVGQVQQRIAGGIPPPNAPSTVARKGSSTPLINTGQLRSSILSRVK